MRTLSSNEVHLYQLDLDDAGLAVASLNDQLLSSAEKDKANRFVQDIHRLRYQHGRTWLRKILSEYVGVTASKLRIHEQEHGKPTLENHAIEFNLSHSENLAVLAVTQGQKLGIDIEQFSRLVELDALSKIHYTDSEREWLATFSGSEKQQAFFWLWTAKEARMKITGEGFALPSTDIEVVFKDNLPDRYVLPEHTVVHLHTLADVFPEAACCLATMVPVKLLVVKN